MFAMLKPLSLFLSSDVVTVEIVDFDIAVSLEVVLSDSSLTFCTSFFLLACDRTNDVSSLITGTEAAELLASTVFVRAAVTFEEADEVVVLVTVVVGVDDVVLASLSASCFLII